MAGPEEVRTQEEVRAQQAALYGAPLADVLGQCGATLGLNQAGLARLLGISAPMLSQLINARRIKIANPVAAARLTRMVTLASDVREGRLTVAAALGQLEADNATEISATTLTTHLHRTTASQVQELAEPVLDRSGRPLRLGLMHAPYRRVLDAMVADGVELAFAGHTHGGQLCLPGYGALVTNCDLDRRRASGLSHWPDAHPEDREADAMFLHVSAGLGTSPYTPVRVACRPEATLLTLRPAG